MDIFLHIHIAAECDTRLEFNAGLAKEWLLMCESEAFICATKFNLVNSECMLYEIIDEARDFDLLKISNFEFNFIDLELVNSNLKIFLKLKI